jgi:predicted N-acetyltransferase YhbS
MGKKTPTTTRSVAARSANGESYQAKRFVPLNQAFHSTGQEKTARLYYGRSGDHPGVHQFLRANLHGPSAAEFQASLDEPLYEPSDRLLLKRQGRVLAHVHLTKRSILFGQTRLPAAGIAHLATAPECRRQGFATGLLDAAESQMVEDGAVIATVRTDMPDFFARSGYQIVDQSESSQASPRDILAHIPKEPPRLLERPRDPLNIRLWRRFELPALVRLYRQNLGEAVGPIYRNDAYWRWLVSRGAFERIYVAIDGVDRMDLDEKTSPIVGYAVTCGDRIVELMASPGHPTAAVELLARVASDGIEQDHLQIRLHAPPNSPLHELMITAGGSFEAPTSEPQQVVMAKLLGRPVELFNAVSEELHQRCKGAGLQRPCELTLGVDDSTCRLTLTRRSVKATPDDDADPRVDLSTELLTRLVAGGQSASQLLAASQAVANSAEATEIFSALFPTAPIWRSPWDDLQA